MKPMNKVRYKLVTFKVDKCIAKIAFGFEVDWKVKKVELILKLFVDFF
jgi:hypothetical protein